ncbi:MAG: OFA family MFS transporter [Bacteroidales bacterium]|nr:OFA family MFS transporter [Bacteroidales bacterium]MDD4215978.1 OFA family MFS transporter [Bacteroidales bacterium]MDY0140817.1 OFA family MFS transporter [Bacteroidales bacterium]
MKKIKIDKKWLIVIMGTLTHLGIGTVYAWSFFQTPITKLSGWSNTEVAWVFSISIFMLGVSAAWGGTKIDKYGPRKLAIIGAVFYALGYIISSYALASNSLWLLYLAFGVLGGIGLGLVYVTPVATVSKWFTKKQGLATGIVIMGFGLGALVMSKLLAPLFLQLSNENLSKTFLYVGFTLIIILPFCASFLKLPPSNKTEAKSEQPVVSENLSPLKYIFSKSFIIIWLMFMINVVAGMVFISFQSPLLQDMLKLSMPPTTNFADAQIMSILNGAGATLIAVSSVFNGLGRFFWGAISDKIGRFTTFRILLALQVLIFVVLIFVSNPAWFFVLVCIILLCYGGGFGVIPSLIHDRYGANLMPVLYGAALTAWGVGGIVGPQIVAFMKDNYPENAGLYAFGISTVLLVIGFGLSYLYKKPKAIKQLTEYA